MSTPVSKAKEARTFLMTIFYKNQILKPYTYPEPIPLMQLPNKIFAYGGPNVELIALEEAPTLGGTTP